MANINVVVLSGNLTRDAETTFTQNDKAITKVGMAINEKWGDNEKTHFVDITIFGKYGQVMEQHLTKGAKVMVSGKLSYSQWEKDGQKRSKLEVIAREIDVVGGGKQTQNGVLKPPVSDSSIYDDEIPF